MPPQLGNQQAEHEAGQTLEQNITMQPSSVQLQSVSVTAAAERGTVNEALDQQRTATGIVSAVTAEQITKSPDSDAAQAVQRAGGGRLVLALAGLDHQVTSGFARAIQGAHQELA